MRINAPHMKTESLPSSISAAAPWTRLLTPPVPQPCVAACCAVLAFWLERHAAAVFALSYVQVPDPQRQLLPWGETSAIAVLEWRGERKWGRYAAGVENTPPVFLLLPFLHLVLPPPPASHAISRPNSPQPPRP